jgi:PAS domain S-box-containing protein
MKRIKISIKRSSFFILLATATFTMFSISVLWIVTEIVKSRQNLVDAKISYQTEQRMLLKDEVKSVVSIINFSRKYSDIKSKDELQNKILDYVSSIRLNHGGYLFINTYNGRALIFDGVKIIGEKDIRNMIDPDGLNLFEIELQTIKNSDGGYFSSTFKRLDSFNPVPKLSYVIGYKEWEWIIGAGIYLDDIDLFVQKTKNQYQAILFKKVLYIVLLFIVLLIIVFVVSKSLSGFIRREFLVFMSFLNKKSEVDSFIDINMLQVQEFRVLAHSVNAMINKRRVAERLLKKESDKAHKYLDVAGVIILALDTKGNVTLINKRGCETLGLNEAEIIGKNWFKNFVPPADKHKLSTRFSKVISGSSKTKFLNGENQIVTQSGEHRIISWQNTLLYDSNDKITGSLSSGHDITEGRLLEASYFESEEKYKLLFEITSDPILIIGRNDTFIDCNNAAVEILKFKDKKEIIGTHLVNLSPTKQPDGSLSVLKAKEMIAKARKEGYIRCEWLQIDKNKKPFYVDASLTLVPISGVEYLYVVWRDISERKKQAQELIIAKEKAEQSDNIKSSFLHNMQHEIRTPLNTMMGFSQLLKQQDLDSGDIDSYFDAIISSGNQLNKIIDDIIDFSKLQLGFILSSNKTIELKTLLSEIFKENYPNINNKPVKFLINTFASNKNTVVETDLKRLKQIMVHLIDNAFKFTAEGVVEFGYNISAKNITFYVSDTGVGIEKQHFQSIFERFTRLTHKNPEMLYGGNGLGLSISKAILGFLGGKIWVESEKGKGSKFLFTIPYKPLEISYKIQKKSFGSSNITVVTINKSWFTRISKAVRETGVKLTHITNGLEAIEFCQKNYKTDLMIMDINLSEMNGLIATKAIKAFKMDLPIIALVTAEKKNMTKEDALIAGCDDYITMSQSDKDIQLTLSLYLKTNILALTKG